MNYFDQYEEEMERWRIERSLKRPRRLIGYLEVGALVLM